MPKGVKTSTAWKPGQSGNPDGRRVEKIIADQMRIVLNEEATDKETGRAYKKLRLLAEKIVQQALDGCPAQQAMILDRIDGKVPQTTQHEGEISLVDLRSRVVDEILSADTDDIGKPAGTA